MKLRGTIITIIATMIITALVTGIISSNHYKGQLSELINTPTQIDTIIIHTKKDTIYQVKYVKSEYKSTNTITSTAAKTSDSTHQANIFADTIITHNHYNDSISLNDTLSYKAYISDNNLDSINITHNYPILYRNQIIYQDRYIHSTINTPDKRKHSFNNFNYGIQLGVGYGMINRKPDIYVGFGISYNFR